MQLSPQSQSQLQLHSRVRPRCARNHRRQGRWFDLEAILQRDAHNMQQWRPKQGTPCLPRRSWPVLLFMPCPYQHPLPHDLFFSHANAWLFSSNIGHLLLLVQARATGQTPRGICQYTRANTHTGNRTERNVQSTCTPHPLCVSSSFASRIVPALLSNRVNLLLLPPPAATSPRRCCYRCRCPLHRPAPRAPRWRRTEARAAAGRAGRIWRRGGQQSQRNRQCTEAQTTSRRRAFWSWQGPQASRAKAQRSTAREEHQHSRAFVAACSLCFVLYFCSALAVVFFFSSVFDDDKKHSQPTPRFVHNPRSLPCQMCVCVCVCFDFDFDFFLFYFIFAVQKAEKLAAIREHRPFFTYYMSFCQV